MNTLYIIGASGHGKVVADIATLVGYQDILFLDDNENVKNCGKYEVVGRSGDAPKGADVFVAIGNSNIRKKIIEQYLDMNLPVLIHPNAVIAEDVKIGEGTVVMAGTVINPGTTIGEGCIINTGSSVDHDCVIGDYSHIAVGTHLCGTVHIGNGTWVGAGTIVSNNIYICENCTIGVGTMVTRDIQEKGTFIGSPARRIK